MTSFDVIAILRKITHIKQIGHSGTLDPFATGVLPVCIGKSTRLIEYLDDDKEYIATVKFGADTDTYDLDGQIVKTYETEISKSQLEMALNDFKGEIEQYPPKYSAIKVNGKKLYEYARKGQEVEIKPRKVIISKIELLEFDEQNQIAKIIIGCSKGTYIRSVAYDIGQKLNCGGHLIALERTKSGKFTVKNAIRLDDIKEENDIKEHIINPIDVLSGKKYILNEKEKENVMHGIALNICEQKQFTDLCDSIVFLVYGGKIVAVGQINNKEIKIKKVFEVL